MEGGGGWRGGEQTEREREREIMTVRYKDGAGCRKINLCLHPLLIHHLRSAATCWALLLFLFVFCSVAPQREVWMIIASVKAGRDHIVCRCCCFAT